MRRLIFATISLGALTTVLWAQNGPDGTATYTATSAKSAHYGHKTGKSSKHHHRHHQGRHVKKQH